MATSDDLVTILTGHPRRSERIIYSELRKLRKDNITPKYQEHIRNTLQRCCPESDQWNGKDRLFKSESLGIWRLRKEGDD
jgi:hypothetical protein